MQQQNHLMDIIKCISIGLSLIHISVAAIDSSGHILKYSELLSFSEEINSLLPERSLLFLLTENNVGGIAWSIGSINSGNVPLILNAHTEQGLYHNLFDLYRPAFLLSLIHISYRQYVLLTFVYKRI